MTYKIVYWKHNSGIEPEGHYAASNPELVQKERDKLLASKDICRIEKWRRVSTYTRNGSDRPWVLEEDD